MDGEPVSAERSAHGRCLRKRERRGKPEGRAPNRVPRERCAGCRVTATGWLGMEAPSCRHERLRAARADTRRCRGRADRSRASEPAASPRGPWRSSEAPRGGGSPSDIARGRGSSYAGYFYTRWTVDLQGTPAGRSKDRKRRFLDRSRLDEDDEGHCDGDDEDPRDPQVTVQPATLADHGVSIRGQILSPKVPKGSGSPFSGERSDLHVGRYPGEGEADDVAHVRALQQLRVLDLEAHGHACGHEARDLV